METLLTESMICFATLLRTAGNFRQDGTQLELIEYHAGVFVPLSSDACSPRIDQGRRDIVEMRNVTRSQCGMAGEDNSSNHRVPQFARTTLKFSRGHQSACLLCGFSVKGSDAMVNSI